MLKCIHVSECVLLTLLVNRISWLSRRVSSIRVFENDLWPVSAGLWLLNQVGLGIWLATVHVFLNVIRHSTAILCNSKLAEEMAMERNKWKRSRDALNDLLQDLVRCKYSTA